MNQGDPITIMRVNNGFVVQPDNRLNISVPATETFVFQTITNLQLFINQHFENKPTKEQTPPN